ncbi:hypothetical protein AWB61_17325 [Chromobacterium sp. F49]|nr:hypothetical protein Cv017_19630 [Chromobacterium subtsugae]KZE86042.1 hypothetical protein AWB61_17325 [Chromobacterium sp. F49]OBU85011.1 hypothetical protein MY55_18515 [Chromobacterium subtsugae]
MCLLLPAGLHNARNLALHGDLTQLVATQTEFAEYATRTTGDGAATTLAYRGSIARQLLQLQAGGETLFFREALVVDGGDQGFTLGGELLSQLDALFFTVNQCKSCHVLNP